MGQCVPDRNEARHWHVTSHSRPLGFGREVPANLSELNIREEFRDDTVTGVNVEKLPWWYFLFSHRFASEHQSLRFRAHASLLSL